MTDPERLEMERNTIFVLAGILLTAIVSIAFFNLDRHPAFPPPSDEFIEAVGHNAGSVVFAHDPLAIAAFEERQSDLASTVVPLTMWPPEGPVLSFGNQEHKFASLQGWEQVATESVWSLWMASDFEATPFFGTATVEVDSQDRPAVDCRRDADGAHRCAEPRWTWVRQRDLTIEGERQTCIWAHPMDDKIVRVRFPNVVADGSDGQHLYLESALRDDAVGTGAPVDFTIQLGEKSTSHTHRDRRGWQATALPVTEKPEELVVEVAADRPGRRHICFRFDLR